MAQNTFGRNISALVKKYKTNVDQIIMQTVQEFGDRVISKTPVDTGFARNSWYSGINGSPETQPSPPTKGQTGVPGSASGAPGLDPADMIRAPGNVWNLRNGAAYIGRLERGHSAQAPSGFVRVTIAQFPEIVAEAARQVGAT